MTGPAASGGGSRTLCSRQGPRDDPQAAPLVVRLT